MIKIHKLCDVPLKDAYEAWVKGFNDYYVNITMNLDHFTYRLGLDGLSPSHSFVAYADGKPAGILLNGITDMNGKRWAWNGGTSVAPHFRSRGIASKLIESSMNLYKKEAVDIASLEAFGINKKAIRLYENFGYQSNGPLFFYENKLFKDKNISVNYRKTDWTIHHGIARDVRELPFYNHFVPWKTQWKHIINGESLIVKDESGNALGYVLFQKILNKEGHADKLILCQCETIGNRMDIMKFMLSYLLGLNDSVTTYNLPDENNLRVPLLKEWGFKEIFTDNGIPLEQVFMTAQW